MFEGVAVKDTVASEVLEVDLTEFFDTEKPVVFKYRTPSIADVYAVSQQHILDAWQLKHPDIPREMAQTLEFLARLHMEPASSQPMGEAYYELLVRKMDAFTAARFIAAVMRHIAPWAHDLESLLDEKKVPFAQGNQP